MDILAFIGMFAIGAAIGVVATLVINNKTPTINKLNDNLSEQRKQIELQKTEHIRYKHSVQEHLSVISEELQHFHQESARLFHGVSKASVMLAQDAIPLQADADGAEDGEAGKNSKSLQPATSRLQPVLPQQDPTTAASSASSNAQKYSSSIKL